MLLVYFHAQNLSLVILADAMLASSKLKEAVKGLALSSFRTWE